LAGKPIDPNACHAEALAKAGASNHVVFLRQRSCFDLCGNLNALLQEAEGDRGARVEFETQ